jgi:uncharacterized protein YukE
MNLEEMTDHAGAAIDKLEETIGLVEELTDSVEQLHGVLQGESSGHSVQLHLELHQMLSEAKLKAEELTGCLAQMRNN